MPANNAFSIDTFASRQRQRLRNVAVLAPSLIWILQGNKQLLWRQQKLALDGQSLLLCPRGLPLTFDNLPFAGRFESRVISLHSTPDKALLELSQQRAVGEGPRLALSEDLAHVLKLLCQLDCQRVGLSVQRHWLAGLYQLLAEKGALHWLYSQQTQSLVQQLSLYLAQHPAADHTLESACEQLGLSRATLIRRLKEQDRSFRQLLLDVRMNYALCQLQQGERKLQSLALACGYQSASRFAQRFEAQFGLSPKAYISTLQPG